MKNAPFFFEKVVFNGLFFEKIDANVPFYNKSGTALLSKICPATNIADLILLST